MSLYSEKYIPISHLEADWIQWTVDYLREQEEKAQTTFLAIPFLEEVVGKFDLAE